MPNTIIYIYTESECEDQKVSSEKSTHSKPLKNMSRKNETTKQKYMHVSVQNMLVHRIFVKMNINRYNAK